MSTKWRALQIGPCTIRHRVTPQSIIFSQAAISPTKLESALGYITALRRLRRIFTPWRRRSKGAMPMSSSGSRSCLEIVGCAMFRISAARVVALQICCYIWLSPKPFYMALPLYLLTLIKKNHLCINHFLLPSRLSACHSQQLPHPQINCLTLNKEVHSSVVISAYGSDS